MNMHVFIELHYEEADQPHVVGQRHPAERHIVAIVFVDQRGAVRIGEQVLVGEHDALGFAGRTRGELDEGEIAGRGPKQFSGLGDIRQRFDQERAVLKLLEQRRLADLSGQGGQALEGFCIGVQERLAELAGHPQELVPMFVADADGQRHRDDAAADGGPKTVHELFIVVEENDQLVAALGT